MNRRDAGLTIFDALVAIGVVAALAAIAVPASMRVRMYASQNHPGAALKQLTSHEAVWKQGDYDRNGVADYWTRDVAGFYAVHGEDGKMLNRIDKSFARSDTSPGAAYPEVAGDPTPKQGYFSQAMRIDEDGAEYVDAHAPPPRAGNAPAGPCTNATRFGFTSYPNVYGMYETLVFFVGQDGVVWMRDLGASIPVLDRKGAAPEKSQDWRPYDGGPTPIPTQESRLWLVGPALLGGALAACPWRRRRMGWSAARWRIAWILAGGGILLSLGFAYASWGHVNRHRTSVCSGCGALLVEEWTLGVKQVDRIERSPLTDWAERTAGRGHAHRWRMMSETTSNAYGRLKSCACGYGTAVISGMSMIKEAALDEGEAAKLLREIEECEEGELPALVQSLPERIRKTR